MINNATENIFLLLFQRSEDVKHKKWNYTFFFSPFFSYRYFLYFILNSPMEIKSFKNNMLLLNRVFVARYSWNIYYFSLGSMYSIFYFVICESDLSCALVQCKWFLIECVENLNKYFPGSFWLKKSYYFRAKKFFIIIKGSLFKWNTKVSLE